MESSYHTDSSSIGSTSTKYQSETVSSEERSLLQLLQKGISETNEENIVFGKEISHVLSKLNLDLKTFPNDIREGLQKVALILKTERLYNFDETELQIIRERKTIAEKKRQREEKKMALMQDNLFRKYMGFEKKLTSLQEAVNSLENLIENMQKEDINTNQILLCTKLGQYQQTVEKLETDLNNMEVEDLYPDMLLNKYNQHLKMSEELTELNQDLSKYADLPPNLLQAKMLLEAKQKEYESLEKTFFEKTN